MSKRKRQEEMTPQQLATHRKNWEKKEQAYWRDTKHQKRGYAFWENYVLDPIGLTEEEMENEQITRLAPAELQSLCRKFVFGALSKEYAEEFWDKGIPASKPRNYSDRWRTRLPTPEEEKMLSELEQGSEEWLSHRAECIGASDMAAVVGASHYVSYRDLYRKHIGEIGESEKTFEECVFFMWGHIQEHVAKRLYSIVMRAFVVESGITVNKKRLKRQGIPSHVSFDGNVIVRRGTFYTNASFNDSRKGVVEIKCPSFSVHSVRNAPSFPFHITLEYSIQTSVQMDACNADWNDLCSMWAANKLKGLQPLPRVPRSVQRDALIKALVSGREQKLAYTMVSAFNSSTTNNSTINGSAINNGGWDEGQVERWMEPWPEMGIHIPVCSRTPRGPMHIGPDIEDPLDESKTLYRYPTKWKGTKIRPDMEYVERYGIPLVQGILSTHLPLVLAHVIVSYLDMSECTPTVICTEWQKTTIVDLILEYLGPDWYKTSHFLCGQVLIMRHYRNPTFADAIFERVQEHVNHVRRRDPVPPIDLDHKIPSFNNALLQLHPLKRLEFVIHPSPQTPKYEDLFPRYPCFYDTRENMRWEQRGVLLDSFRQSATVEGKFGINWRNPVIPETCTELRKQFYMTVFVTSYPNSQNLASDKGISIPDLEEGRT